MHTRQDLLDEFCGDELVKLKEETHGAPSSGDLRLLKRVSSLTANASGPRVQYDWMMNLRR